VQESSTETLLMLLPAFVHAIATGAAAKPSWMCLQMLSTARTSLRGKVLRLLQVVWSVGVSDQCVYARGWFDEISMLCPLLANI